jgi:L-cysteine:1D-myo-inositol 2-amino-2-deoxy-alpha-D-glucopyranoside ligase
MRSWPSLYLPALADLGSLPELRLAATTGVGSLSDLESIRMYVCGITPYDATHLGHAATYLTFDLVNRYLRAQGKNVTFVENITDIDDPLFERAHRDNQNWSELGRSQIELFQSDMVALHILPPDSYIAVTEVIDLVIEAIVKLSSEGFCYDVDGDTYFDISRFIDRLPLPMDEALAIFAERGGDPARLGKRHPLDSVLWLKNKEGEPGWESPIGFGRPGWHIECSVIALRYLLGADYLSKEPGAEFAIDLQGGGSDLIFPHHFMSGAQAEALVGRPFARLYVHSGMVGLDGEKMSKSKGNLVFVSTLLRQGEDPMVIRYALLKSHYSTDRMWSPEILAGAKVEIAIIRQALSKEEVSDTEAVIDQIAQALSNDLDTPSALESLLDWAQSTLTDDGADSANHGHAGELSRAIDALLGLAL